MTDLTKNISITDLVTALLSLLGVVGAAYFGYMTSRHKAQADVQAQTAALARTAEQELRDDLSKQLEEAYTRLDREVQRREDREQRYAALLEQIDTHWSEKAELKSKAASLEAELFAAQRKIRDLTLELEKFEKKVFYIAPKEGA